MTPQHEYQIREASLAGYPELGLPPLVAVLREAASVGWRAVAMTQNGPIFTLLFERPVA